MEFIEEEIDIKYEYDTYDLDLDHDLGSSPHCTDWKLDPNVECRVMLERMKSLDSENEVPLRDLEETGEVEPETTSSGQKRSVDKSCGIYRKLKLLVDVLKNCEERENCELCEKYIQQLQQHLLLTHGNNRGDDHEKNPIETTVSSSEPVSLDRNHVPSEKKNLDVMISHGGDDKNPLDELVPSLTNRSENEGEPISRKVDPHNINRKSIPKGGKSKPYRCHTCEMTCLTFYELTHHKTTHMAEKRDNVRGTNTPLTQSYSKERGLPNGCLKKRFECDVCRMAFRTLYDLNRHKMIHTGEKPYKCDVCGNCFTRNFSLTEHKLTHTGEKPHKCEQCGKCFRARYRLTSHKLVHTGQKTHECGVCGKFFAHNYNLAKHVRTHTRPHKCCKCKMTFLTFYELTQHKTIHMEGKRDNMGGTSTALTHSYSKQRGLPNGCLKKRFECDVCWMAFRTSYDLNRHKRIHTGEKPYKCDVCGNYFTRNFALTEHKLTHTGEKPHKCEQCGKCFRVRRLLTRHKRIHTGE